MDDNITMTVYKCIGCGRNTPCVISVCTIEDPDPIAPKVCPLNTDDLDVKWTVLTKIEEDHDNG